MENSITSNGLNNNFIYQTPDLWHSDKTELIDKALLEFHKECPPIPLDSKAKIMSKDSSKAGYEYSFASLEVTMRLIRPILAKHGVYVMQSSSGSKMTTQLRHSSGQFHAFSTEMADWQGFGTTSVQNAGGTISFYRRYTIFEFLGLATEDIDAQASGKDMRKQPAAPNKQEVIPAKPTPPPLEESVVDAWQSKVNDCKQPEDFTRLSKELAELKLEKESPLRKFIVTAMGARMDTLDIEFSQGVYSKKLPSTPTEKQA
ncbi:MAG TPA: ERF family protein [Saprospiraceae bacterium]|nr:ERF family protein [Saprospiraceae bacterium]